MTHRGLIALSGREVKRVLKLWTQTVLAPILSSSLFILVFGLSLGSRIRQIDGVSYDIYIVPGLIAMTMAQAAYANNSATVFQARFDRYLNDVLAAPMRGWQVNLALNVGGAVRALLIGAGLLAVALALTGVPIHAPFALAAAILLLLVLFCSFGVVVGIYAESWDHAAFVTNLVILPLSFLGGVFYSVARLPSPWEEISRANPVHYLIDAVRYGFLGTSDMPIGLSLGVTAVIASLSVGWSAYLFATGRRLTAVASRRPARAECLAGRANAARASAPASTRPSGCPISQRSPEWEACVFCSSATTRVPGPRSTMTCVVVPT